jgi:exodeoxyribonuclease VIII
MSNYASTDGKQDAVAPAAGVYDNIQADNYHRLVALTKTGLMMLKKSPAHYWHWMTSPPEESSQSMHLGTATHTLVFEPHKWDEEITVIPEDAPKKPTSVQRNAKKPSEETIAAIEWWDNFYATASGRAIITAEQEREARAMAAAVRSHPEAMEYLNHPSAKPEVSIVCTETVKGLEIPCKGRCDLLTMNGTVMVDLKTTIDASAEGFSKSFMSYGYWMQAAHYISIARKSGLPIEKFIFIAVESSAPNCVALYELDAQSLEKAFAIRQRLMERLSDCIAKNDFPANTKGVQPLTMPPWIA